MTNSTDPTTERRVPDEGVPDEIVVAADIGGTFTDIVAVRGRHMLVGKFPTDYDDLSRPVRDGVDLARRALGGPDARVGTVIHATTVATNAVLERRGAKVGMLITKGFADLLEIGRLRRADPYTLDHRKPALLVDADLVAEIDERIDATGKVVTPLDEAQVEEAARRMVAGGAEAVVVGFLHSYLDPVHERRAAAAVAKAAPGLPVVTSAEIIPEAREYERISTAVIAAYLGPVVRHYLRRLADRLRDEPPVDQLWVMKSSGGLATADHAITHPEELVESGPAAGVIAAAWAARRAGVRTAVGFDMGGTTTKAALIMDGTPRVNHDYEIGGAAHSGDFLRKGTGHPLRSPVIDLAEIGTGGGSIAWLDATGALRVGPRSASSTPGPACYGRGGGLPTVTDADLVLGYLDSAPAEEAGGLGVLRRDLAEAALSTLVSAGAAGSVVHAASGVFELAVAQMAGAVRLVSLAKGVDPRELTLIPSGGAGPVHAWAIARELGTSTLLFPAFPGVASALGLLQSEVRVDLAVGVRARPAKEADRALLAAHLDRLTSEAAAQAGEQAPGRELSSLTAQLDMRYAGQTYTIPVDLDGTRLPATDDLLARFGAAHRAAYHHETPSRDVEVTTVRVTATAPSGTVETTPRWATVPASAERTVIFDGVPHQAHVVQRADVDAAGLTGPALVVQVDTTIVVPPGARIRAVGDGSLLEMRLPPADGTDEEETR
ncbi:hydantoinase/oxoprolinase family protein [Nonomuraea sp. MCN248]|uniref:Hydantoinase/oxoprolinase family protein n=1 Tax=Nonomuraea corallina TaxID=2989783 RepID=A0ABT4S9Y6_9ACTN|nr:hydantoinase/oxoprolinase family protein [Nonomuraea corallina]MDA0634018.1 hydantoinase/oxoprolinase family protein [Nonomuraea corallina]